MKNKILIIGNSGFVGSNITEYLKSDYEIYGLSRNDNCNKFNFNNFYAIIFLAGLAHDEESSFDLYYKSNFDYLKLHYDIFLRSTSKYFIYISSIKSIIEFSDLKISEKIIKSPKSFYGISKYISEKYIENNIDLHHKYYILRPCLIYGNNLKGNLDYLIKFIIQYRFYPFPNFMINKSLLSVKNLSLIINNLLITGPNSDDFNISDDGHITVNDLISLIEETKNIKVFRLYIPKFIINFIAKFGDLFNLKFNSLKLKKITHSLILDNSKIKHTINLELKYKILDELKIIISDYEKL